MLFDQILIQINYNFQVNMQSKSKIVEKNVSSHSQNEY